MTLIKYIARYEYAIHLAKDTVKAYIRQNGKNEQTMKLVGNIAALEKKVGDLYFILKLFVSNQKSTTEC